MTAKSKSRQRFEQLNHLIDHTVKQLPTATHGLVLVVCWRHADQYGTFSVSHSRVAESISISRRSAIRIMKSLEGLGVVKQVSKGGGVRPSKYKITGQLVTSVSLLNKHKPP